MLVCSLLRPGAVHDVATQSGGRRFRILRPPIVYRKPSLFAGCPDVFCRFEQIRLIETAHREADSIRALPFRKKRGAALGTEAAPNAGFGIEPSDGASH